MLKSQLAQHLQVSERTLSRWINGRYYADLLRLGYQKKQLLLSPAQVDFLIEKLGAEPIEGIH